MPLHVLSPREVQAAGSGDHADGGGLFLRVKESNANWLLRYTSPSGRRRDMGLGVAHRDTMPAAGESLRLAREKAKRARDDLAAGRDPIDAKRAARRADAERTAGAKAQRKAEALTLARVARAYKRARHRTRHERQVFRGVDPVARVPRAACDLEQAGRRNRRGRAVRKIGRASCRERV